MFYERYLSLCEKSRIAPSTAATQAGFNRGTVSVWKRKFEAGQDVRPEPDITEKICKFFNCSEAWLLGIEEQKETPTPEGERDKENQRIIEKLESDEVLRAAVLRFLGMQ